MPQSPYTYKVFDINTGLQLDPLPLTGVSFGRKLNDAGSFTGLLDIADPNVQKLSWITSTNQNQNLLVVDFLGTIVWAGIIQTRRASSVNPGVLTIGANEFYSYFKQRLQSRNYANIYCGSCTYWDTTAALVDARLVAAQVIFDMFDLALTSGYSATTWFGLFTPFGVTYNFLGSGPSGADSVSVTYPLSQAQRIDSIISNLSGMGYNIGFDLSIDWAYQTGANANLIPLPTFNFYYPRQGALYVTKRLELMRQQMLSFTYDEDGTSQANGLIAQSGGGGGRQPAAVFDSASFAAGYLPLEGTTSHTQVNSVTQIAALADADLAVLANPIVSPVATLALPTDLADTTRLNFADFIVGDDIMLHFGPYTGGGQNSDPRFPLGLFFEFRVDQWDAKIADAGTSTLALTFGLPPSANPAPTPAPTGITATT
jgi:hypothetical protein